MKNPNGFGNVSKLPGKRRNPFRARVTLGWEADKETGKTKQVFKELGCYKDRPAAIAALVLYHQNPLAFAEQITFAKLYEKFSEEKFGKKEWADGESTELSKSSVLGYKAAYNYCEPLYDMIFTEIKKAHLQSVINSCSKGYGTRKKIKVLFNQMYKYAMENDLAEKDYSQYVDIGKNDSESKRKPFTKQEIDKLFENADRMDFIDTILIMIYTGLRIGELLLIENVNIDLENRIMRGGLKTAAGKNRVIPINIKILPFIAKRKEQGHKYLIVNHENKQMKYWNYTDEKWDKIMEQLEMKHLPHDCRHTFATLMDNAEANKLCTKRIMGHASSDITDKVYTHKDIEELKKAVDLI